MATEHDIDGDTEWRPPEIPGVPPAAVMLLNTPSILRACFLRQANHVRRGGDLRQGTSPSRCLDVGALCSGHELKAFEESAHPHLPG